MTRSPGVVAVLRVSTQLFTTAYLAQGRCRLSSLFSLLSLLALVAALYFALSSQPTTRPINVMALGWALVYPLLLMVVLPMRRVALFCTNFLPYSQSFVYEQLRQHRRYEAEVFAWRRFLPELFPFPRVHLAEPSYILTRRSRRFERCFAAAPFDIVHAHFGPGGTYALPFAQNAKLPLVVTFHGYDVALLSSAERLNPINWPYAIRGPQLLRQMSLGLCASEELRQMLLGQGVPKHKLETFRLGIDPERFVPAAKDQQPLLVVMIGRFVEKKGFEYGVRAFARAARDRAARLVLVGKGPLEKRLRGLVEQEGIAAQTEFAGVQSQAEVATLLSRAHVLLAPSVVAAGGNRESGLIVVKEASACQVVPIGTRHGGIPEIIDDGETGFLVAERDVEAMAQRLQSLLQDPELRQRLALAGRHKMLREYDNRERVVRLEDIYDRVISKHALTQKAASRATRPSHRP